MSAAYSTCATCVKAVYGTWATSYRCPSCMMRGQDTTDRARSARAYARAMQRERQLTLRRERANGQLGRGVAIHISDFTVDDVELVDRREHHQEAGRQLAGARVADDAKMFDLEVQMLPALDRMTQQGVRVDLEELDRLDEETSC